VFKTVIVEDNRDFREALCEALHNRFPFCELTAVDGVEDGLYAACSSRPDLMVVDLALVDGSGLELIRRIRAMGVPSAIAVLTIHDLPEYREESMRSGADKFFAKLSTSLADIFRYVEDVLASRYRMLVLAADPSMRGTIAASISRNWPGIVCSSASLEQGLAALGSFRPHLVLLHSSLGEPEERRVCELVRLESGESGVALICIRDSVAADPSPSAADFCLSFGKSLDSQLREIVESLLARHAAPDSVH
jgi:CheY-like chemotaxis protein